VDREPLLVRQVFETWWIAVPAGFDERWVADGSYWHGWDEARSVSVSSTVVTDEAGRPVPAAEIMERLAGFIEGEPIAEAPPDLLARATIIRTDPDARASRALSGLVVVGGRVLMTTITSDDLDWAIRIWRSIRYQAVPGDGSRAAPQRAGRLD
jgi:hypothetical protein